MRKTSKRYPVEVRERAGISQEDLAHEAKLTTAALKATLADLETEIEQAQG